MNLWAVEYEFRDEQRYMLAEFPDTYGYAEVARDLHPALKAKNPTITFVGEVISV